MIKIDLLSPGRYTAGLGDCCTWPWIAAGADQHVSFAAKGPNADMLRLWGCDVTEDLTDVIDPNFVYRSELNLRCGAPRVKIWMKVLNLTGEPKRPRCVLDPVWNPVSRRVILAPQCHYACRTWPKAYWLDLNWSLQKAGYEVVWIMENDDPAFSQRGPSVAYWRFSFPQVIELLMTASVVISNDSMPAHLAGTLGLPTIAVLGPSNPNVFAHSQTVIPMQSTLIDCSGCHWGPPYRAACDQLCQALTTLLPSKVLEKVVEIAP